MAEIVLIMISIQEGLSVHKGGQDFWMKLSPSFLWSRLCNSYIASLSITLGSANISSSCDHNCSGVFLIMDILSTLVLSSQGTLADPLS